MGSKMGLRDWQRRVTWHIVKLLNILLVVMGKSIPVEERAPVGMMIRAHERYEENNACKSSEVVVSDC